MTELTEGVHTGEFIISEANDTGSRDTVTVTVPEGEVMPAGRILGKITSGGKYISSLTGASDGSQTAAAINYAPLDNSEGEDPVDFTAVVINRNAEVLGPKMSTAGDATHATADASFRALGVKVRELASATWSS